MWEEEVEGDEGVYEGVWPVDIRAQDSGNLIVRSVTEFRTLVARGVEHDNGEF